MSCECDSQCPSATHCFCIYTYEDGVCVCVCDYPIVQPPSLAKGRTKNPLTARIDLCVKNVDLVSLGELFGSICEAELLVPALRARKSVSIGLKDVSIADAVERIGLRIGRIRQ